MKNYTEEFEMINDQNFCFVQLKYRVIMYFPYLAKMHPLSFTFGDLKAVSDCSLVDFLDALLQLMLCCPCVFRSKGYTKVINIQVVINSRIQALGDVDFYFEEGL